MRFFIVARQFNVTKGTDNKKAPVKSTRAIFKRFDAKEGSA